MKTEVAKELTLTRIFNAPRELVWEVWTNAKHIEQWWGPKGFTNPVCQWDAKPGSKIHIDMKGPDGVVYPMGGEFNEVVKPERLVFISAALDAGGQPLFTIHNTITFVAEGSKTKVTMQAVVTNAKPAGAPHLAGMNEGWNQSLDKLADYINKLK